MSYTLMIGGTSAPLHRTKLAEKLKVHPNDAGIDLFPESIGKVEHHEMTGTSMLYVHTGVRILFPVGTYGHLIGRSSTVTKLQGGDVVAAVIDSGYTGELLVRVVFPRPALDPMRVLLAKLIAKQVAIAQIIPVQVAPTIWVEWNDDIAAQMGRGDRGFGSTDAGYVPCQHAWRPAHGLEGVPAEQLGDSTELWCPHCDGRSTMGEQRALAKQAEQSLI